MTTGKPRVLFVDDEPAVLEALSLNLRRSFDVVTATSGAVGLEHLRAQSDFAVVVSDMRMPKMDGATFLALAFDAAPDTVRMLLTGHADLAAAIKVVNHGHIFRFLTKPCPRESLQASLESAVAQHRLVTGERVLLEQTLRGSIKMLVDLLAIASPAAFGRANQIRTRVLQLAALLGFLNSWELEIAALASQLGYVVLPHELCQKIEHRVALTEDELRLVVRAPELTEHLLANIPRLENVRAMLALHIKPPPRNPAAGSTTQLIELGAHLLRLAIDLEAIESIEVAPDRSPVDLLIRTEIYDPEILDAARQLYSTKAPAAAVRGVSASSLRIGMVLAEDVRLANGTLLVTRGYEITAGFIERIKSFAVGLPNEFRIIVQPEPGQPSATRSA